MSFVVGIKHKITEIWEQLMPSNNRKQNDQNGELYWWLGLICCEVSFKTITH